MKITIRKSPKNSKIAATASLETDEGIKIYGFKILKSNRGEITVYYPSRKKPGGGYANLIQFSREKQPLYFKAIENRYRQAEADRISSEPKAKPPPLITSIRLSILFHFVRCHKKELTALRIWLAARNVLDAKRQGAVEIKALAQLCGLGEKYLMRVCARSPLFYGLTDTKVYYKSMKRIIKMHRLNPYVGKNRSEKVSKKFARQFRGKQYFEGYIYKCFMENDLDNRHRNIITRGRISYEAMAENLRISRRSAIYGLKKSKAEAENNIKEYHLYAFESEKEFSHWLLLNMDTVINGHRIRESPKSYFVRKKKDGSFILCQSLPKIYAFTGYLLVEVRKLRGKMT